MSHAKSGLLPMRIGRLMFGLSSPGDAGDGGAKGAGHRGRSSGS
eukprot:COSAG04_NODE_2688_length_3736_cov_17.142700_5_plen_43_part_01